LVLCGSDFRLNSTPMISSPLTQSTTSAFDDQVLADAQDKENYRQMAEYQDHLDRGVPHVEQDLEYIVPDSEPPGRPPVLISGLHHTLHMARIRLLRPILLSM
jgi:hypothetical protein